MYMTDCQPLKYIINVIWLFHLMYLRNSGRYVNILFSIVNLGYKSNQQLFTILFVVQVYSIYIKTSTVCGLY